MCRDCLLYTSDAADERRGVDLGGRRIIKKSFFQAEDGILDMVMSRGLGDVYKRQLLSICAEGSLQLAVDHLCREQFIASC